MPEPAWEVMRALAQLRRRGHRNHGPCLKPQTYHLPIDRVGQAEEFAEHARVGEALGVAHAEAGRQVRSGYHAGKQLQRATGGDGRPSAGRLPGERGALEDDRRPKIDPAVEVLEP
jgi:lipoate synthase